MLVVEALFCAILKPFKHYTNLCCESFVETGTICLFCNILANQVIEKQQNMTGFNQLLDKK